jgi:amino acid adenylation domain-containing protein
MADFEREIGNLSPAKQALLARRRSWISGTPGRPTRSAASRETAPLSFAQQRLWLIQQLDPESHLYNVARALRLRGRLETTVLERSLNEIISRHEALRTTFPAGSAEPVQKIAPALNLSLPVSDLSGLGAPGCLNEATGRALEVYRRPFDLTAGPLIRAELWRLEEEDHVLLVVMHHIISDGWSLGLFFDELGALYQAFLSSQPSPLTDLPIQYADFAVWQRERMQDTALEKELTFWRDHLAGAPAILELPCDRPRPKIACFRGKTSSLLLTRSLSGEITSFARKCGVTLFPAMLAALKILLFRWSGERDLVVGTVSANRNCTEVEKLLGCFLNFLALRDQLTGQESAKELLGRINKTVLGALSHQECPFEKVVEAVNPQRLLNANPLYNISLMMQNFPDIAFRVEPLEARFLQLDPGVAFLDLRFIATETAGGILLECEFNAELFENRTIDWLLQGYQDVLRQIVERPDTKVSAFSLPDALITQAEQGGSRQDIAITATFTAEPLLESLEFWMKQLGIASRIDFAPYNQVLQQLLDPLSLVSANARGINVVLLRLEDWQAHYAAEARQGADELHRRAREFAAALEVAVRRSAAPYIVCIGPASRALLAHEERAACFHATEELLIHHLNGIPSVALVTSTQLLASYPVKEFHDEYGDRIGHIPYTPAGFMAVAAMLARRIYSLRTSRRHVVVLDCNQTLWAGDCAKQGALGVEVNEPHRMLQEFFLAQQNAGMNMCLCATNAEEHVRAVFERNPGMRLKWEHVLASRFSFEAISEKLSALAKELGLDSNTFVFVSGNLAACALVRENCPEVLVAQLPPASREIPTFLDHFWAFDRWAPVAGSQEEQVARPGQSACAQSERLTRIASHLSKVDAMAAAMESDKAPRSGARVAYMAPRSHVEETLADIWLRLLQHTQPGIYDDFFASGGNSLLAVQVVARVRQMLGVEMPLRAMFDAPTIASFAERVEVVRRTQAGVMLPPLVPAVREGHAPVTFVQQRLWFIDQFEPGNPIYNTTLAVRMHGPVNVAALEKSLGEIVRRHEVFRTTFQVMDGQPAQVIAPELTLNLALHDLTEGSEDEREAHLYRQIRDEARRPFDLAKGPLLRSTLLRLGAEEHVLILAMHHIVSDRWSVGVLAEELRALYGAFALGNPSPLPELPIQYADFAVWQRSWLAGEALEKQAAYWKKQLEGAPAVLEVPTDRPRPALQSHLGAVRTHFLPKELLDKLSALSQSEGATLFMTLLAAFQTLLSRYSGQEDVVVGSPIAGRNYTEIEPLIGFFVNTLAFRTDLSGDPSFVQLLARVKEVTLGAYAHQDIPFEKLVEELRPQRSVSYHPIFQVVFALQNAPMQDFELPGLKLERLSVDPGTAAFDLSCFAMHHDGGLLLRTEYNTDLFDEVSIARFLSAFHILLDGIAARPESRISDLPLLSPQDERRLLMEFNDTARDYPQKCVHELFTAQAESTPNAVAIVFRDEQFTYGELDTRSSRLASHLRGFGVGPDVPVGLYAERSPETIVALLGILKAGGAYVPMDLKDPADRLAFLIENVGMKLVLTQRHLSSRLPAAASHVVFVDSPEQWETAADACEAPVRPTLDNLAYLIYTSGSTGEPKAVEVPHRGVVRLLFGTNYVPFGQSEVLLHMAPLAFDASTFEIWGALLHGSKLVLFPGAVPTTKELGALLVGERVTTLWLTASLFNLVIDSAPVILSSVRQLLVGGEALSVKHVRRAMELLPHTQLINGYGPTENTTFTTCYRIPNAVVETRTSIPLGRPISNTRVYVLDKNRKLVPVGVPGELYIGGDGLARGYRNRPNFTAQKFIRNPFSAEPGDRLYATGDLVRYLPDGNLEFLGRMDDQVKLRGFRIELGEVEAVLAQQPGVQACVVVVREDTPGNRRLVGYVVPQQEGQVLPGELRKGLQAKLPEYMVPSAFQLLSKLPLSPNGKADRKALLALEYRQSESEAEGYEPPRTPLEKKLAAIWCEVLQLPRVGVHDNFFDLGGHSLLATQVVSRLRATAGVELPLRFLFESPAIRELAARVDGIEGERVSSPPPIPRVPRGQPLPLSFAQQRLWFLDQLDPNNARYNVTWIIRMKGVLYFDALLHALNEIVRRHEILRTTFMSIEGRPFQVIAPELKFELPVVDLSEIAPEIQEAELRRLILEDASRPFNLTAGPVLRGCFMRLNVEDHALVLNCHHIVNDGWSLWQFMKELGYLFEAFSEGRPSPLGELPIQYADYAVWQRRWMSGDVLDRQLAFWKKRLEGAPDTLEVPSDRPRPAVLNSSGAVEQAVFPTRLADRLHELSRAEDATLYMTLLAAYQTLLFRYTGQEDIVVGSPIANRTRSDIEALIGFFVNTMVMRTDLSGNPSFRELLRRVREFSFEAYNNQDLPFEKLVEVLHPDRYLGRLPLFQVWFALQNAPRTTFRFPGLDLTSMDVHNGTSKFDLGLFVVEKPEGLICKVEYSTELFDAATIQRLLRHYRVLLEAVAANPDEQISQMPLLAEEERRQIVVEWNNTRRDIPRECSLHQFIEDQVERTPEAPALVFESEQLSYRQLNVRANQLAHRLRSLGVGPEKLVAVCMDRSVEMVVGLLGAIKAGGAYVPLDPDYPPSRLAALMDDTEARVVLTLEHLEEKLSKSIVPKICLDRDWDTFASESVENPPLITSGLDQVYMIYTSGSTGKPKGVPNVHQGIVNRLLWMQNSYGLDGTDRILQKTPYSFDVSVWEFFWPLMTGSCLVLAKPEGHKDPNYLVNLIVAQRITTMHFVPSMLRIFLESEGVERCKSLRRVICSGEALTLEIQKRFFQRLGGCELHNLYGPTEASVDVSCWPCTPESGRFVVPIGKPIWNTQLYILDKHLQPVPAGVAGELHIGGIGLARGYWKQTELTAQNFIRDPFSTDPGARLYKTGDLARFFPDGNIEYLGRIDHQVKIRGFRIELGEIETTLDGHPGVRQSVVMAREDKPGDKRLVAYIVVDPFYKGSDQSDAEEQLVQEQLSQWAATFDEAYQRGGDAADASFNIAGWNSSYTGKPIPTEEMRTWVETTVDRIFELQPKRVWEIGCGTGLLLFRVAPQCERYFGTDVSQTALHILDQQLHRIDLKLPQVKLENRPAHQFDNVTRGQFDTVILNSVVQYFPDVNYLVEVLTGAVGSVASEGCVFIGDVRSFPLLETFHGSVQLVQSLESLTPEQFWLRVNNSTRGEGELLVDPEFFIALRQRIPRISKVEIQLKRGRSHNELTRFRYDVILHVGKAAAQKVDCDWLDWHNQRLTPELLLEILQKTEPKMLSLTGVPNARLQHDVEALRILSSSGAPQSLKDLRETMSQQPSVPSVEPEDLWAIEEQLPYKVEIRSSRTAVDGCCDVVLHRTVRSRVVEHEPRFPGDTETVHPLARYANNPLRQKIADRLVPQLRSWLSDKLPEYMLPSAFVVLDSMPLSANGKVNRHSLPAPEQPGSQTQGKYVAPGSPSEEIIAGIFSDVLHLGRVGVSDDFFELGGHSLSATQVVARVRQALQIELPLRSLFESPNVASLAKAVARMSQSQRGLILPPIVPVPRNQALPLSFAQQRLWFLDQLELENPLYNMPRSVRMKGTFQADAFEKALNDLVERHEILRTTYGIDDSGPSQVIAPQLTIRLPVVDLSGLPLASRENEARRIVNQECQKPFNLAKDPILRALLVRLDTDDHVLVLNTHHIASDGWSSGVLFRDLTALYRLALEGTPASLPELTIQYADYAVWQRGWLQGEILEKQLTYWRSRLAGTPPVLNLPIDRPRPEVQTFRGATARMILPTSLVDRVLALSRQRGSTVFMTLLAGFESLLFYFSRQTDIVLGTDIANRTDIHTEDLIGFFVNLLVLRTDLSGDPSFEELLCRVREVALGAYSNQDLPFDKLVEELQPERSLSHNPIVQALFVHLNTPRNALQMPGLELSVFNLELPSKFDIAVFVVDRENGAETIWLYNPDLFDASTVSRMMFLYQICLETVIANPSIHLGGLVQRLSTAAERQRAEEHQQFEDASLLKLKRIKRRSSTGKTT